MSSSNKSHLSNCGGACSLFILLVVSSVCSPFCFSVSNGCAQEQKSSAKTNYNLIIICLDSLRADHLGCYNYFRKTSPAIDKFAQEAILFEQAISQASWSLPSHCSIFTSRYVASHGVIDYDNKLSDSEVTLAEILKLYGYRTAAFTGGFWVSSIFNIGQGFDIYREDLTFAKMADIVPVALDWLEANRDKKFFLFLQGFDGHSPFALPESYQKKYSDPNYNGIFKGMLLDHRIGDRISGNSFWLDYDRKEKVDLTNQDIQFIIDQYDGSVNYADTSLSKLFEKIDELNLRDNTIVILTSYHGAPLFEHGIILRRKQGGLFEGVIRVPLVIRHPNLDKKGIRIPFQVQHIDIMPTVLDFLGIPVNHQAQGKSLIPLIEGKAKGEFDKYVFSSGYKENMVRTQDWKLIDLTKYGQGFELYDLKNDLGEKNNLIRKKPKIVGVLKEELIKSWESAKSKSEEINRVPKEEINKIKDNMKKAGYWFLDPSKSVVGRED